MVLLECTLVAIVSYYTYYVHNALMVSTCIHMCTSTTNAYMLHLCTACNAYMYIPWYAYVYVYAHMCTYVYICIYMYIHYRYTRCTI